jgi:FkbM family methyltransferase
VFRQSIRFFYDSAVLAATNFTTRQKLSIWRNFAQLSVGLPRNGSQAIVAGFKISYFDRPTLAFLFREIFVRQVYRLQMPTPEPFILDCGANLGMATLFFKFLYPECQVRCFEPDPNTFQLLQKNVADNRLQSVEAFNVALWRENSSVDFFCDPVVHGSLLMSTSAARVKGPAIKVPARRLSEFIDRQVDYLKLDVEGAELRVLQELSESGKLQHIHQMAIEYHHRIPGEASTLSVFLRILEDNGFEYQIVAGGFPDPSAPRIQDIMIYARHSEPSVDQAD